MSNSRLSLRQWLLIGTAALWAVLAAIWYFGPGAPGELEPMSWLTILIAVLPLLIVYELSTMAIRWLRRRRGSGRERPHA